MRNRLVGLASLIVALCCLQLVSPGRAYACKCITQDVQQSLQGADAVFAGTVTSVTPINQQSPRGLYSLYPSGNEIVLSVNSVWKGGLRPQATLATGAGGACGGYDFKPGSTYLIYAYNSRQSIPLVSLGSIQIEIPWGTQHLTTEKCTRTALLSLAAADLAQLGQGSPSAQPGLLDVVLDNLLAVVAGIAAILIVIIVYLLRRNRRGRSFRLKP